MVDVGEQDRLRPTNPYTEHNVAKYVWGACGTLLFASMAFVVFAVLTGINVGRLFSRPPTHDFSRLFAYLDAGPLATVPQQAFDGLLRLEREPCDHDAMYSVGQAIAKTDKRWVGDAYFSFGRHCGSSSEGYLREAAGYYNQIGDHRRALLAANTGIDQGGQADADIHYAKAIALGGMGRHSETVPIYDRIFSLNGKAKTFGSVFFAAASQYAALGRFCDAADTMRSDIDTHPADDLATARTVLADYSAKCRPDTEQNALGFR